MSTPISRIGIQTYNRADYMRAQQSAGTSGKFGSFMRAAGKTLGTVGGVAAGFVPGGTVVKAAVMGAGAAAATAGNAIGAEGAGGGGEFPGDGNMMDGDMPDMSMTDMLMLQYRIQKQVMTYTALSNVSKARHDATMSAVRNIK